MRTAQFIIYFVLSFSVTFILNTVAIFIYNVLAFGRGGFNWEITFLFAFTLGLFFPIMDLILTSKRDVR
ncbi:MAG: hypothetical protein JSW64_05220 [Candidatus Zixiibacteriota bacterium]|nr:MAG: hypothetical protein JSW64_05220 [candidate division Zixibacteria bacterium]